MEGELGGLVDLALEVGGVLDARHLQQDAVVALAHDGGLDGAGLVDAAAQDLDRLVDHFLLLAEQVLRRSRRAGSCRRCPTPAATDRRCGSPRSPWRAGLVAQHHDHGAAALHGHVLEADLLLAQLAAHRIGQVGQAFVQHRAQVGFEQEMRAAAQVEAEIDAALLVPARQWSSTPAGSRLGSANSPASAVTAMMAMVCQRGRLSMTTYCVLAATSSAAEQAAQQALALGRRRRRRQHRLVVLVGLLGAAHRFAARQDVGDGLLDDAHPHAFCEFHLQLVVADHLGDQADDAAAGDDAVAALHAAPASRAGPSSWSAAGGSAGSRRR